VASRRGRCGVERLIASLGESERARIRALAQRYDLSGWPRWCEAAEWRESLWVLDLLDRFLPGDLPEGPCLDVGSRAGGYLPGLAALRTPWLLVERDAYRRYLWLATREAHGRQMAARVGRGCRYLAGDAEQLDGRVALITWLLPYVRPAPLRADGLPESWLRPAALLKHLVGRLGEGGALLIVNQGEVEAAQMRQLLSELQASPAGGGLVVRDLGSVAGAITTWRRPRFGFLLITPPTR